MAQIPAIDFFSMGMFCVDEIHTAERSYHDVIGGAGTYAALGAGIVAGPEDKAKVCFLCDMGHDFSENMLREMKSWGFNIIFREDKERETTKAWNKFVNNEERLFKYLSPKSQIIASDMVRKPAGQARCIHSICSPTRCEEFMRALRAENLSYQKFVWEPVPTQTSPENFGALKNVITTYDIDVLSPNALEAASLVGLPEPSMPAEVESLVDAHYGFAQTVVIRCGAMGSYLKSGQLKKWYPAYFSGQPERVIDPSGAGNAFCGGLGIGIVKHPNDWDKIVASASVGSSFMIEQVGPPHYDPSGDEWNKEKAEIRVQQYLQRLHAKSL